LGLITQTYDLNEDIKVSEDVMMYVRKSIVFFDIIFNLIFDS